MTVRECYNLMQGDYDDVLERLLDEKRVQKFMLKFLNDESFYILKNELMITHDYEKAFRAVHTLKGVAQTLGFTQLYQASVPLTDALRSAPYPDDLTSLFQPIQDSYSKTVLALKQFRLENGI